MVAAQFRWACLSSTNSAMAEFHLITAEQVVEILAAHHHPRVETTKIAKLIYRRRSCLPAAQINTNRLGLGLPPLQAQISLGKWQEAPEESWWQSGGHSGVPGTMLSTERVLRQPVRTCGNLSTSKRCCGWPVGNRKVKLKSIALAKPEWIAGKSKELLAIKEKRQGLRRKFPGITWSDCGWKVRAPLPDMPLLGFWTEWAIKATKESLSY